MSSKIKTPIFQDAFKLDPEFQGVLKLIDEVNWSLSIMTGRKGGKQVPIACGDNGNLSITDSSGALVELLGQLTGDDKADGPFWDTNKPLAEHCGEINVYTQRTSERLKSSNDVEYLAEYFDSVSVLPPLYSSLHSIAEFLDPASGYSPFADDGGNSLGEHLDTTQALDPFYYGGDGIAEILGDILEILNAVWSNGAASSQLRVTTI